MTKSAWSLNQMYRKFGWVLLLPGTWNVDVMAGAALAILGQEVSLEMETIVNRETR